MLKRQYFSKIPYTCNHFFLSDNIGRIAIGKTNVLAFSNDVPLIATAMQATSFNALCDITKQPPAL